MKVISINLNGIRAAARKGFYDWLAKQDADFVCMQETKAQMQHLPDAHFYPEQYVSHFANAEKKGYSGVGIYAKRQPEQVITTLDLPASDSEGRYVQFDYPDLRVASIYMPSGTSGEERQAVKYELMDAFMNYMRELLSDGKPTILCGDWNIAHTKKDIKNWRGNQKNSGFLPEERAWLDTLFTEVGFVDAFRVVDDRDEQYTWWSNRGQAWANNTGWRIDYQIITPNLRDSVRGAAIYKDERFSDHAPLIIDYEF